MKRVIKHIIAALPILVIAFSASAHDPSMHAKKPEKAKCSALDKMKADKQAKGLKMDMSDPVVLAMMKKCSKDNKADHEHSDDSEHSHSDHDEMANGDNHSDGEHKH